jgi:hypothetical protein
MSVIILLIHLLSIAIVLPPCDRCPAACAVESNVPREVHVRVFNQSRLDEAGIAVIVTVANRLWAPYGVTIEAATTPGSLVVIIASGSAAMASGASGSGVLGTTMFSDGHATPNIHLWLGAAEALARRLEYPNWPAEIAPPSTREAPLLHVMGVALAHEIGHYLLDTTQHSTEGLLRARISLPEMEHADPGRLTLTCAQRRTISGAVAGR